MAKGGKRKIAPGDVASNRQASHRFEFLDRIESQLTAAGAVTMRRTKEIFSKPAALALIDEIAGRADLVVEALAD